MPFNGTYFMALDKGIYSFHVNVNQASYLPGHIYLYQGDSIVAQTKRQGYNNYYSAIVLQATVKLEKGNKVHVRLDGDLTEAGFQIGNSGFSSCLKTCLLNMRSHNDKKTPV